MMPVRSATAACQVPKPRGWHYREDYPFHDDNNWLAWVLLRRGDGGMTAEKLPLPEQWLAEDPSEKRYDRPSWDV